MKTTATCGLTLALWAILSAAPAASQGLDLAGLHDQRREGAKWCMTDHFHSMSGTGPSRQTAERDAVAAWQGFTAWEYGGTWGAWRNAGSKTLKCDQQGAAAWSCTADARPCQSLARSAGTRGSKRRQYRKK